MTLRNFIGMLSDPTEIETVLIADENGKRVASTTYFGETTIDEYKAELAEDCKRWGEDEDYFNACVAEFLLFHGCLDHEVIQIDLLDRDVWVRA